MQNFNLKSTIVYVFFRKKTALMVYNMYCTTQNHKTSKLLLYIKINYPRNLKFMIDSFIIFYIYTKSEHKYVQQKINVIFNDQNGY